MKNANGFTLLEVVIVMGIVAVLAAAGSGFYTNYNKNVEIKSIAETIIFDLKQAQSNSMTGVGGFKWGVHFVNGATDYYEIFSTPTDYSNGSKVIDKTIYLPGGVTFSDPAEISTKDIIFQKIRGGVDPSSTGGLSDFSITLISQNISKKIIISIIGNINQAVYCDGSGSTFSCGNACYYNGDTYPTVLIGTQCWFAENLRTTTYPDGSAIKKGPAAQGAAGWFVNGTSYYSCPPNSGNTDEDCVAASDSNKLGYMYQWNTAMNGAAATITGSGPQGICPSGWQVPTDDGTISSGWGKLFSYVDTLPGCTGATGACLKIGGTTGFNAPFAGNRNTAGTYISRGTWFNFWSASDGTIGTKSWNRRLYYTNSPLSRVEDWKLSGFSVRCLKNN